MLVRGCRLQIGAQCSSLLFSSWIGMRDQTPPPKSVSQRFSYLDVVRGLAAAMVVATHIFELGVPNYRKVGGASFNLGLLGVLLFFIVSGTVISSSIERSKSLKVFWAQRFWRLFPAYWVSLVVSATLFLVFPSELNFLVYGHLKERFWASFGANLTMLQGFLGFDHFIPAYWTLGYEMMFYFALSLLFAVKLGKHSHYLLWVLSALIVFFGVYGFLKGTHVGSFKLILCGYFWMGIWVQRMLKNEVTVKQFWASIVAFQAAVAVTWYANFLVHPAPVPDAFAEFPYSPLAMAVAFFGSTIIFLSFLAARSREFPKAFIVLGNVSYSLYLFHPLAMSVGGKIFDPTVVPFLFTPIALTLTVLFTTLAYRYVELPSLKKVKAVKLAAS